MRWRKRKIEQVDATIDDPQVAKVLEEITSRLNSTSSHLEDFSANLQMNINTLRRYAASAEKRVQGSK